MSFSLQGRDLGGIFHSSVDVRSYHHLYHLWNCCLSENDITNYAQSPTHLSSSWRNMLNFRHRHRHAHTCNKPPSSLPEPLFLYLICVLLNMVIIMKGLSCAWFNLFLCLFTALLLPPFGVCALVLQRDTACVLMSVCACV